MALHAGDVYLCRAFGTGKPRPVVVVSREELNRGGTVLVVPLTTARVSERAELPTCVRLQRGEAGLSRDCVAQADALTIIDAWSLDTREGYVGALGVGALDRLIAAIGYVIAANCTRN